MLFQNPFTRHKRKVHYVIDFWISRLWIVIVLAAVLEVKLVGVKQNSGKIGTGQCDQMAMSFIQYLTIKDNEKLLQTKN